MKRRTNAEIERVRKLHEDTDAVARAISERVNGDDDGDTYVHVSAGHYWNVRAKFEADIATDINVSFTTKDAAMAERVAAAVKAAVRKETA